MAKKLGRTARFYRKNRASYRKKLSADKRRNSTAKRKRYKRELAKKRYHDAKKGNSKAKVGSGYDYDHGSKRYVKASTNRGKTSGTPGDRRARGKKKK